MICCTNAPRTDKRIELNEYCVLSTSEGADTYTLSTEWMRAKDTFPDSECEMGKACLRHGDYDPTTQPAAR